MPRGPMSEAERAAHSKRMKAVWAKKRKARKSKAERLIERELKKGGAPTKKPKNFAAVTVLYFEEGGLQRERFKLASWGAFLDLLLHYEANGTRVEEVYVEVL